MEEQNHEQTHDEQHKRGGVNLPQMAAASGGAALAGVALALGRRRQKQRRPSVRRQVMMRRRGARTKGRGAPAALKEMRGRIEAGDTEAVRQEVARRVGQALDTARTELPPRAREVAARSSQRWRGDVAPAARGWAQEAVGEAESIIAAARRRAGGMAPTARQAAPPITAGAAAALAGAGAAITGATEALSHRLSEALNRPTPSRTERARRTVTDTGSRVLERTGSKMTYVAGESAMIVGWTAALGAVVYFGLLSPDQRTRLRGAVSRAFGQIREMISDFDGIFEESTQGEQER